MSGRIIKTTNQNAIDADASETIPAGNFSSWLRDMRNALETGCGIDVPCGDCCACCSSSLFIHVAKDEKDALRRIPKELLFKAPGLPEGTKLMGYDARGRCPMLTDKGCAIYAHRPVTCRTFDCRVFAATGIPFNDANGTRIAERAARWRFSYPDDTDRTDHAALKKAADFIRANVTLFPEGFIPRNDAQLAVLAVRMYGLFMNDERKSDECIAGEIIKAVQLGTSLSKSNI